MVDCARLQHEQCQVALSGTKECSSSAKHSGEVLRKMGYSAVSGDDGAAAAAAAKSLQSCPTLCNPIDSSPPGPTVPGILQERTLEWVAISSSIAWKWKVKVKSPSRAWLLVTPWTAVYQAPPSMGFSRQEYWSGLPLPSPRWWWRNIISSLLLRCPPSLKRSSLTCCSVLVTQGP